MKAEKGKPSSFAPIIITLETEEEARHLWQILDCAPATTFLDYAREKGFSYDGDLNHKMWKAFSRVYYPNQ